MTSLPLEQLDSAARDHEALRILVVAYAACPYQGSEPGKAWYWAEALAARGHRVELLIADSGVNLPLIDRRLDELGEIGSRIRVHVASRGPAVRHLPLPRQLQGAVNEVVQYMRWQRSALALARAEGLRHVDVVHHLSYGSIQAGCALSQLGPPLVLGPVGGGQTAPWSARRLLGRGWPFEYVRSVLWATLFALRPTSRRDVRRSALVLSSNAETDVQARRMGSSSIVRAACSGIPSSLLVSPTASRPHPGPPTMIWVGKFEPKKGPFIALDAMPAILAAVPDARLVMVGDGPLTDGLHERAAALGVDASVDFLGRIDWPRYLELLDTADLLLFTAMRDSFGTQNVEAWARGVPTVGVDHQGVAAHAGPDNAELVALEPIANLPQRLGDAAGALLVDRPRLDELSRRVRLLAVGLTYEAKAETSEAWYDVARGRRRLTDTAVSG